MGTPVVLLAWLAAAAARADTVTVPVLIAAVRVRALGDDPFCASGKLESFLPRRLFSEVGAADMKSPDLTIECSSGKDDRVRARVVLGADGAELASFAVKRFESDLTARLIAEKLAETPTVLEAAQRATLRENAGTGRRLAMEALEAGRWQDAVERLNASLESDAEPAPLHKALSIAHAELGNMRQARWHYVAYARSDDLDIDEGDADLVSLLRRKYREGAKEDDAPDSALRRSVEPLRGSHDAREAHRVLRRIVATAPWADDVCALLAEGSSNLRWKLLARHWKRRAAFTRAVSNDTRRFRELNALLER